jgi:hypothetical protein
MTTKEKANELIKNMEFEIPYIHDPTEPQANNIAKQCALIAVDEILESHYFVLSGVKPSIYNYWQEVKQEIEKL